jgi:rRNA maturation endonuclease Nob1
MNPFISRKEIRARCRNPKFCIACFRIQDKVKVDEHHVCKSCRNDSVGMPRKLQVVTLKNGESYFVDNRLRQLRNILNPHDYIDY